MKFFSTIVRSLTTKEKAVFMAAAVLGACSLFVLAGVFVERTTVAVPAAGGEYVEGMVGQPVYVNPVLASSTDRFLIPLLFANLPALADAIEMEKDGMSFRVHLREGLTWSDGVKLTSDDAIFTVASIQDASSQSPLALDWQGVSVERVSELEIRFRLAAVYPFFADTLDRLYLVPKHLYGETPPANWRLSDYNLKPVSSGPYRFDSAEMRPDGFISAYHLAPNPAYAGDAPYIRRVTVRFFSTAAELIQAFNSGRVDGFGSVSPELLAGINRSYRTFAYPLPSYYAVFWNQSQNPVLADALVRRVLGDAVDRAALVLDIFRGDASAEFGPIPGLLHEPAAPASSSSLPLPEVLEKAGWRAGENGLRTKTVSKNSSLPLRFTLTVPQIPFLLETAERLKSDWARLGAEVELRILPPAEALQAISNRDYQALLYGNILNPPGDLYAFWHSNERFYPGLNLALYSSRRADQLIQEVRRGLDPAEREEKLRQLNSLIAADNPAVFLYSPAYIFVTGTGLSGVVPQAIAEPAERLRQISSWYVRTARTFK